MELTSHLLLFKVRSDDTVVILSWEPIDGKNDVDLDLIVKTSGELANVSAIESTDGTVANGGEGLLLYGGFPAGTYNMHYPYYSGTSNNVKFTVYMLTTLGTLNGKSYRYGGNTALTFSGTYKSLNVNKYTDLDKFTDVVNVAQTMVKNGINFTNISAINVPASGSRTVSKDITTTPIKLSKEQLNKMISSKIKIGRK